MAINLIHKFYSQALIACANPLNLTFSQVRDSDVKNIQEFKKSINQNNLQQIKQLSFTITRLKEKMELIQASHEPLTKTRENLGKLCTSIPQENDHQAHLFIDSDDNSEEHGDEWEQIGSDEEIIS